MVEPRTDRTSSSVRKLRSGYAPYVSRWLRIAFHEVVQAIGCDHLRPVLEAPSEHSCPDGSVAMDSRWEVCALSASTGVSGHHSRVLRFGATTRWHDYEFRMVRGGGLDVADASGLRSQHIARGLRRAGVRARRRGLCGDGRVDAVVRGRRGGGRYGLSSTRDTAVELVSRADQDTPVRRRTTPCCARTALIWNGKLRRCGHADGAGALIAQTCRFVVVRSGC